MEWVVGILAVALVIALVFVSYYRSIVKWDTEIISNKDVKIENLWGRIEDTEKRLDYVRAEWVKAEQHAAYLKRQLQTRREAEKKDTQLTLFSYGEVTGVDVLSEAKHMGRPSIIEHWSPSLEDYDSLRYMRAR